MTGRPGLGTLAAFIAELRAIGLPISVSENVDATAALMAMPLVDRASLKSALAGTYYLYRTLSKLDLDTLLERLLQSADAANLSAMDRRLARDDYTKRVDAVRTEVEAEIRRRLVADRGAEAVAGTLRRPLPEDVDFLNASQQQLAAIRQAVQLLGRKMAARLTRKRRHNRQRALDFRRTIRQSLGNGGGPGYPGLPQPQPAKPGRIPAARLFSSVAAVAGLFPPAA